MNSVHWTPFFNWVVCLWLSRRFVKLYRRIVYWLTGLHIDSFSLHLIDKWINHILFWESECYLHQKCINKTLPHHTQCTNTQNPNKKLFEKTFQWNWFRCEYLVLEAVIETPIKLWLASWVYDRGRRGMKKNVAVACCSNLKQCYEAFQTLQRSWIVAIFVGSGFLCLFTADSNMTFRMDLQSKTQQQPRKKTTPYNQLLLCVWSWRLFNWESRNYVRHFIVLRSTV